MMTNYCFGNLLRNSTCSFSSTVNPQNADAGNNAAGEKTTGGNHLVLPIHFK